MSKYEVKLVNIGEEVDNRIRELEIELKDIRKANDNLTRANESYRQENIDLRKENYGVEVAMLTKKVDDLEKEKRAFKKMWAQREKTLELAIDSTTTLVGDITGIAGHSAPVIQELSLPFEDDNGGISDPNKSLEQNSEKNLLS